MVPYENRTKGNRTNCSNITDATGKYVWHEDGVKDGRCFGLDFEKVERECTSESSADNVFCDSTRVSTYVPYAYDAVIALAHGLDKLVKEGYSADQMTASRLSRAIRESSFVGATGPVLFDENGDRSIDDATYIVYNYQKKNGKYGFEEVGLIDGSVFKKECTGGQCSPMIFSDGTENTPNVKPNREDTTPAPDSVAKTQVRDS